MSLLNEKFAARARCYKEALVELEDVNKRLVTLKESVNYWKELFYLEVEQTENLKRCRSILLILSTSLSLWIIFSLLSL